MKLPRYEDTKEEEEIFGTYLRENEKKLDQICADFFKIFLPPRKYESQKLQVVTFSGYDTHLEKQADHWGRLNVLNRQGVLA